MTTVVPLSVDQIAGIFPGYRIHHLIGAGGMGAVYQATQLSLDRLVAIKILPPEFVRDPALRALFEDEAKAMARLNHPNLIAVHDFGEAGDIPYIIMEYVHGCSLHHSANGKAVHPSEVIRIIVEVCAGLAYAHQHGIIHCDIKPANILLNQQAQPKIGDFGLARRTGPGSSAETPAFGSKHYSAPEIMQRAASLDTRADIFSVGVVLHELLTTRYPSDDRRPASALSHCDRRFDAIIRLATMPDPAMRYSSIQEMAVDLTAIRTSSGAPKAAVEKASQPRGAAWQPRNLAKGGSVSAASSSNDDPPPPPKSQSGHKRIVLGIALGLVGLVVAMGMVFKRPSATEAATEHNTVAEASPPPEPKPIRPEPKPGPAPITHEKPFKDIKPVIVGPIGPPKPDPKPSPGAPIPVPEQPVVKPDPNWNSFLVELYGLAEDIEAARKKFPDAKLKGKYRTYLEELIKGNPNLGTVQAAEDAIKFLDNGQEPLGNAKDKEVKKLEETYIKNLPDAQAKTKADIAKLIGEETSERFKRLKNLVSDMAKRGQKDEEKAAIVVVKLANVAMADAMKNGGNGVSFTTDLVKRGGDRKVEVVMSIRFPRGGAVMKFCYCPPGGFMMGSPPDEKDRGGDDWKSKNENQVRVYHTKGYWMAQTECTQKQWMAFMVRKDSKNLGDDFPVAGENYDDIQQFIKKLNDANILPAGWKVDLPTEAQWEYACRAGTTTAYSSGDILNAEQAHFGPKKGGPCEVKGYPPNAWGLFGMHGNVGERCADFLGEDLKGGLDPVGKRNKEGDLWVFRGGNYFDDVKYSRAAFRFCSKLEPAINFTNMGFRLVLIVVP